MMDNSNCLEIIDIQKKAGRIEYFYKTTGKWQEFLNEKENMFVEYDYNIESIPDSIAIVPLLSNILPISWVFNLKIKVKDIDESFYKCLSEVKKGYSNMHPMITMLGDLEIEKTEKNTYKPQNVGVLFSGGVDATNTLVQHINEKPILLTLWGSDIKLEDELGWKRVIEHHIRISREYNLDCSFIKTNFRTFINEIALSNHVWNKGNREWWHDFQHGIGILGHIAPIAYLKKMDTIYIASSSTPATKNFVCASDPTIDNYLKYANCNVIHDGYNFTRQDKVHNICEFAKNNKKKNISLRVCWESSGGENCCECEKCYRTIMEIIAEKSNPNDFGFDFTEKKRKKMMKKMPRMDFFKYNHNNYYSDIQKVFIKNFKEEETQKDLKWFRKYKFKEKSKYKLFIEKMWRETKNIIKKVLRKNM